ncbi:MAG: Asp-tRNA(Asn)/Glu-tRNA(Gln) amidotransferase subunit GatB [bacterium]|nr:Asp-tRNA(Asn)/Glu-tRNA(Gln) amidotransferase subunit GatB [bacterium]
MEDYKLTIGLEVHAELSTKTKMFCGCLNNPDEKEPNINICPVCLGYPGTLPVINKEAIKQVLRFGVAVSGELANFTEFDRKNYFYPDIPKGYQISQYKYPLVTGGILKGVRLTRVHLEEDTAKSSHTSEGVTPSNENSSKKISLIDYNRAGVPLMELVTEPVIHRAEEAADFARELQLTLWYLGASEANMEKGEMRVEANISVSKLDDVAGMPMGTKVEVKNLNSFKAVEKAIRFEFKRQVEMLEKGDAVVQETRGWNENIEETFSQRAKENSHDYRYFPDPDLPKMYISEIKEFTSNELKETLPELPSEKRKRLKSEYNIKDEDIEIYVRNSEWGMFFEEAAKDSKVGLAQLISNYISTDLPNLLPEKSGNPFDTKLTPIKLRELIKFTVSGELSSRATKDILKILVNQGGDPKNIAENLNLFQKNTKEEIIKIATKVVEDNQKVAEEYKLGNKGSIQFLIGQGMKVSNGSANPQLLKEALEELLK